MREGKEFILSLLHDIGSIRQVRIEQKIPGQSVIRIYPVILSGIKKNSSYSRNSRAEMIFPRAFRGKIKTERRKKDEFRLWRN